MKEKRDIYWDFVDIDRVDGEASNILFVLKTDTPSPTSDINTAAVNEKRSLFIDELIKSYFYSDKRNIFIKRNNKHTVNNLEPVFEATPNIILLFI
jgi:hypothetical protein